MSAEMLLDPAFDYMNMTAVGPDPAEQIYSVRSADYFAVAVRTGSQSDIVANFVLRRLPSSAKVAPTLNSDVVALEAVYSAAIISECHDSGRAWVVAVVAVVAVQRLTGIILGALQQE